MLEDINNEDKKYMPVPGAFETKCLVKNCCSEGAQQNQPTLLREVRDSLRTEGKKEMDLK